MRSLIWAIIALVFIWLGFLLIDYIRKPKIYTLSYKACSVQFTYYMNHDTSDMAYIAAENKLALCLCESYISKKDISTSKKIMELYNRYGDAVEVDSGKYEKYKNIDSVLKYKKEVFNTLIGIDD